MANSIVSAKALDRVSNFLGGLEVWGNGRVVFTTVGDTGYPVAVETGDGAITFDIEQCNLAINTYKERGAQYDM